MGDWVGGDEGGEEGGSQTRPLAEALFSLTFILFVWKYENPISVPVRDRQLPVRPVRKQQWHGSNIGKNHIKRNSITNKEKVETARGERLFSKIERGAFKGHQ